MDRLAFESGTPNQRAASQRYRIVLHQLPELFGKTVAGSQVIGLGVSPVNERAIRIA